MIRPLLIALFTSVFVHAEEAKLSVRTLAIGGAVMDEWHVATGEGEFTPLEWPDSQPSAPITAQAGKEIELLTKAAGEDGNPEYKAAQKVAVPESAKEILLLGAPAGGEGEIQVIAVPDNFKTAEFSDWLVINQSERMVTLRVGKDSEPIELESGQAGIYKLKGEPDKGAEVTAEAKLKDGEMRKIFSTFWSASSKQRSLVIFQDKDGRPKVQRIIDFLPLDK